jgi:YVTN family beta-propeller protein
MSRTPRSRRARVCTFLLSISAALLGPTRSLQAQPPPITPGLREILASGDPAPGGTVLASGGLGNPTCLAPDGRMVVDATTINGADMLLCVDGTGPHVITQAGDPAPNGFTFGGFYGPCAFTDDGAIIFSGWSAVPNSNGVSYVQASVYRASPNGIEHVFGDGDAVRNGSHIEDSGSGVNFISNRHGSVLAYAEAGDFGLFLWHDGQLDVVRYGLGGGWGLTDHDEVALIDRLNRNNWPAWVTSGGDSLLVWSHGIIRVVLTLDSMPGGPFVALDNLAVRGDLILFSALDGLNQQKHQFFYRIGDAQPQEIPGANLARGIVDFTPGGHILSPTADGFQLIAPTGDVMGLLRTPPEFQAFGLNDAGTIAFLGYGVPTGSRRYTLEIAGPGPTGSCPLLPTPGGPTATPTPMPTPDITPISGSSSSRAYVADAAADIVAAIDTATQSVLAVIPVPHRPSALAAAPDGSRVYVLASDHSDQLGVIDARTAQLMATIPLINDASVIGAGPDDHTAYAALYAGRIERIDTNSGTISSVLLPARCRPLGFAPGGGTLVATILSGSSFDPHADLAVIDTATGQIVGSSDGCSNTSGFGFSADGNLAYVFDDCRNVVEVVDVHTAQVVNVLANEQWSGHIAIASDGSRAYTTHSGGSVSVIELTQNGVSTIAVPGAPDQLALTPDGGLLYVTTAQSTQSPLGQVAVIDTASKSLLTTILLDGWPTDVIVAPAPPAAVPPPTPTVPSTAAVLLRADNVEGVTGDVVPFTVRLDTYDREVGSVEAHLLSTTNEPFLLQPDGRPDCVLAPGVAGTATFEFEPPSCWGANCYSLHFVVRGIDATQSLPHSGTLFTCSLWIRFQWPAIAPLLLLHSTATAPDGAPIAVTSGDGSVTVLSLDQATPRPTRTAWPTATSTATPTLTATPLPAVVSIDSIVVPAGTARAAITIRLQTNAAHIAGEQNDIVVSNPAMVAANGAGAPACTVNPAINKPDTAFAFLPPGCQPDHGGCIGIRGLVLAVDNVAAIPDGSVLYSCEVTLLDAAPGGSLPLQLANVHASDPAGNAVPVVGQDGTLTITAAAPPTVTRAPAATPTSTPTVARNGGQALAGGASDPNVAAPTTGGGCSISPAYNASSNGWLFAGVATLVIRRRLRTEGKRRRW